MAYHYYNYEVYLEAEKAYTLADAERVLSSFGIAEKTGSSLALTFGDWKMRVHFSNAEHIRKEAAEIAERYAKPEIASCDARFEIYADDDPDDAHYNDHLYVLEALATLPGAHVFDMALGEFAYEEVKEVEKTERPAPDTDFLVEIPGNEFIEHYIRVLKMHPRLDGIWLNIGTYYQEEGREQLAVQCYQNALALNPDNGYANYNMATYYRNRIKDPDTAKKYYLKAIALNPNDGDAPTILGRMYADEGDREKAIEYMLKGYAYDPGNHFSSMSLGYYYVLYGQPGQAIHYADIAIALGETSVSSMNKGNALLALGRETEAIRCYVDSLTAFEKESSFWADYDSDYELMPQYEITKAYYENLKTIINTQKVVGEITSRHLPDIEANPGIHRLLERVREAKRDAQTWEDWLDLGCEYSDAEKQDPAFYCYHVSALLNRNNPIAIFNIGQQYLEVKGNDLLAEMYLRKAMQQDPQMGGPISLMGVLCITRGEQEQGMALLARAVEIAPNNEYCNHIYGYYLLFYGQPQAALPYVERSMEQGDTYASIFNRAHIHLLSGETEEAVDLYFESLSACEDEQVFWSDFDNDYEFMYQYIDKDAYEEVKERIRYRAMERFIYLN